MTLENQTYVIFIQLQGDDGAGDSRRNQEF